MSRVQVVLFCKGKGSDESSFRPNRDESQWWNRRDALVRCVAAFLFGPTSQHVSKSLILLFDEDWARIELERVVLEDKTDDLEHAVPIEQNVIGLLKRAAEATPGTPIKSHGMKATMTLSQNHKQVSGDLPSTLDSKRSVLEYLQKTCSMEFLRQHGLNSSTAAILKKTNKKKLIAVWNAWMKQQSNNKQLDVKDYLTPILRDILDTGGDKEPQTIAGVLHESGDAELPVWNQEADFASNHRILLFLGAVRDMLRIENECLKDVCREKAIPLIKMRLGRVAEFTSKILTVVAFHASHGVLWPGMQDLVRQNNRKRPRPLTDAPPESSVGLQVIICVPLDSNKVVADLSARSRILWCLVRCCVVTLWRSKVHAGNAVSPLLNDLHLVFRDGMRLSLKQDELVANLAEQHQAAPSEFQILSTLQKQLALAASQTKKRRSVDWNKEAESLVKSIRKNCASPFRMVSIQQDGKGNFSRDFYSRSEAGKASGTFILVQHFQQLTDAARLFTESFMAIFLKKESDTVQLAGSFCDGCVDTEAASITMMQHMAYQGRLDSSLRPTPHSSKAPKHDVICGLGEYDQ